MSLSLRLTQELTQKLRLDMGQKQELLLTLLSEMRNIVLKPTGECTGCGYSLSRVEILEGFNEEDCSDYTTECPRCRDRFLPSLERLLLGGKYRVGYICRNQTLDRLCDLAESTPDQIEVSDPRAYHGALVHFGTLRAAFRELGHRYRGDVVKAWKEKVRPFLGEYPDALVANCVGVSRASVQRYRSELGVEAWQYSS